MALVAGLRVLHAAHAMNVLATLAALVCSEVGLAFALAPCSVVLLHMA